MYIVQETAVYFALHCHCEFDAYMHKTVTGWISAKSEDHIEVTSLFLQMYMYFFNI